MKLSIHARDQLNDRYKEWGLNFNVAVALIGKIEPEDKLIYRMIIIDDIPIVLICNFNEVITIYPHPVDAAENWRELIEKVKNQKESIKGLRKALSSANNCNNESQKYIKKIEKKNKHLNKKMKGMWK